MFGRSCACVGLAALLLVSSASGQDKEDPIIATVKKALKDKSKPFTMLVLIKVKEGEAAKFEEAFVAAIKATRKEKGNLVYNLNRSLDNPNEFVVFERWKDFAALESHINSKHIQMLLKTVIPLLDAPPEIDVLVPAGE
ncbi:MAG: putative quinol monooxygenase [Gemmataceae bacterium]